MHSPTETAVPTSPASKAAPFAPPQPPLTYKPTLSVPAPSASAPAYGQFCTILLHSLVGMDAKHRSIEQGGETRAYASCAQGHVPHHRETIYLMQDSNHLRKYTGKWTLRPKKVVLDNLSLSQCYKTGWKGGFLRVAY